MGARPGAVRRGRAVDPADTGRDRAGMGPRRHAQRHRRAGARAVGGCRDAAVDRRGVRAGGRDRRPAQGVTPRATDVTYFDGLVSHLQCLVLLGEPGVDACVDRLLELAPDGWPDYRTTRRSAPRRSSSAALTAIEAGVGPRRRARGVRRRPAAGRGGGDAGRPELAVRPAPARPAGQARGRSPGRDAELVARAGRDRRRARSGRGRAGAAGPGRGRSTRRRAPGHAGRPRLTGRRRPRRTPPDPAQARHGRVHVELVPRPGRHLWRCSRRCDAADVPERRRGAADSLGRPLPALAAHLGHPRAPLAGLLGQRRPLLRHRRRRLAVLPHDPDFALALADDLVARAYVEGDRAYWRFTEHRNPEPLLPPGVGWMQGAAGIAGFLFEVSR